MEEYSERTIHKSETEPGNSNVNTVYFIDQAKGDTRISRTEFVYDERREHKIANVYLYLNFLLRIMFVKNIVYKLFFKLKHYQLM